MENSILYEIEESSGLEKKPFETFPDYKRSPRMFHRIEKTEVEISRPSEKKKMGKESIAQIVIPPLTMAAVTAGVGIMMGRGIYILMSLVGTVMTVLFSVFTFIKEKKTNRKENALRESAYEKYLLEKRKEIYRHYTQEETAYRYHFPPIDVLEKKVTGYDSRLYEKTYMDDDFLVCSIGTCTERPLCRIKLAENSVPAVEKDPLFEEAEEIAKDYETIQKPVAIDLKKEYLGLIGDRKILREQLQLLLMQLAVFHSYHELEIVFIYGEKETGFDYLRWLPHLKIHAVNALGSINTERKRDQVLGSVYQILKERKKRVEDSSKDKMFLPYILFVVDEPRLILEHPVMEFLESAQRGLGYSVIYTTLTRGSLPENIDTVVSLETAQQGKLVMRGRQEMNQPFVLPAIRETSLEWMARNLSGIVHIQGMQNHIPDSITFFEMYGIEHPAQLRIRERWKKNHSEKSLAVPLGVRGKDDYVYLNLHEKAHGPHGLVAGTTGSGKSEIVQSYILSLAVNFHPYEVGFLLIDYKGGGMASLFKNLPHLLGTITNLDGSESARAMASIKSELARRQRIFQESGVNHINGYNRLFREGKAEEPLPHLFLISDEFAELKKEQPEFMSELVSAARIGRSLGVHLILATQKPSGVVDDQIWSNSKFKLALKVQNESDSREVLKTTDAASIVQPGRAYLQVGNNEIYELFQSAWSGAAYREEKTGEEIDDRIYLINDLGQGELINGDLSDEEAEKGSPLTQLDATVDHIRDVAEALGLEEVRKPWQPPLPDRLVNPEKIYRPETAVPDLRARLGVVDIPEQQTQEPYVIDFSREGNLFFAAAPGYGKTVFLTTAALSLALKNRVEALHFYVLDFGNSGLIPLNRLHHTADYITFEDTERRQKFMTYLEQEVKERRKRLADAMAQNFAVYNQGNREPMRALVILLDNYDVVRELGAEMEDFFQRISRDGAGLGIFMIATATRSGAMKYAVFNNFKNRMAGCLSEAHDAANIIGRSSLKPSEKKGRVLVKWKGTINAMQTEVMADYEGEADYNRRLEEVIGKINSLYPDQKAARIAVLPDELDQKALMGYEGNCQIRLGLNTGTVQAEGIDKDAAPFAILGEAGRGKTTVMKVILGQIAPGETVYLFDSPSMELYGFRGRENLHYVHGAEEVEGFLEALENEIGERNRKLKEWIQEEEGANPKELPGRFPPFHILADDWDYLAERTKAKAAKLAGLLAACEGVGIRIILTAASNKLKGFDEVTKFAKSCSRGLLLGSPGMTGMFPVRLQRDLPQMGDGLLFRDGSYERLRLPEWK
ncbi:MAG: type VII secretion protein EssC [Blautia sp.]|nr:type VII secretion protein EssC [Lachnoclostridium sp.]MCM1212678.1 type VII secretion protein EssC [Blautia sp.]